MSRPRLPRRSAALLGLASGVIAGLFLVVIAGSAVAQRSADRGSPILEATHLPPALRLSGEPVELRYDGYCIDPSTEDPEASCAVTGSVFVRAGDRGEFDRIDLQRAEGGSGTLVARVPADIASAAEGFSYYAVLETSIGAELTVPAGGASAPQRSLVLERPVEVDLGRHQFGVPRGADERVVEIGWGSSPADVGLEHGRGVTPIGASSFDVDANGTILVLDQAHGRVLRWRPGASEPERIPTSVLGTLADMSLSPDGTFYVLETVGSSGRAPLVRHFDTDGRELDAVEIAERGSRIGIGPGGPVVLQYPAGQWMPVAAGGFPLDASAQRRLGRNGRPLRGGGEVVLLRRDDEILLALSGPGGVRRSWRVTSETPLAEVQLTQPLGSRLVVVVRVYTDSADEFAVLVLDDKGLSGSVSLDSADWAETAPLGRFRLSGSSLYQLGSTPNGAFVDRFDLEVR